MDLFGKLIVGIKEGPKTVQGTHKKYRVKAIYGIIIQYNQRVYATVKRNSSVL